MAILLHVTHEGRIDPSAVTNTPQYIENCNMFDKTALEKSLTYITIRNYWSLYDVQKRRVGMQRFDIPFSEFKQEYRLPTENHNRIYSKRYVYYMPTQFIDYRDRKDYKRSQYYNVPVDFTVIGDNPSIFTRNFLLFIDGRFISTAEVLPLEDKTGVIIDVASSYDRHGIPLRKYRKYKKENATVTIFFVPNFTWSRFISNRYVMVNNSYTLTFSKFNHGDRITKDSILLINTIDVGKDTMSLRRPTLQYVGDYEGKRFNFKKTILSEFDDTEISDNNDMISTYDFLVLNFDKLFQILRVNRTGYFKVNGRMPVPRENMLVFSLLPNGNIVFDHDLTVDLYYPNIYHIIPGKYEDCEYLVYCFYDEGGKQTNNEEYVNQIALYEEYVNLLKQYITNLVPEELKKWYPSNYDYGIEDYDTKFSHLHLPNTLFYKIFKMYDTIAKDPWALKSYINFLLCPSEKYYIDITKLSLEDRVRMDTTQEPIVEGTNYVFSEPTYVFAMNRRYLKRSRYDFRIWIDGLFLRDEFYHMELGLDYYYIYIPTRFIKEDSMMEIERHKLFDFHASHTFSDMNDCVELLMDGELVTSYAHDIYVVNETTREWVNKSNFTMKVYSNALERWVEIDPDSFALLDDRVVKIYPRKKNILGVPLRIGIHKGTGMQTSAVYEKDRYQIGDWMYVETTNHGNYKSSDYRVFNNGKSLLPIQWQTEWATIYGGRDNCRTNWALTKGDQITVDHVPCSFRTVFYQATIPDDGLVDVDGKLNLPINLKWYDIYLNGVRLHHKNLKIVSPTKFYIKGMKSNRHLIILDRNRDNDVFYLAPHWDYDLYEMDRNDTIIDKLIHAGLRELIWIENDPIDNSEPDIGDPGVFGPGVLDAIVYFLQYLKYKYINCNYKLLSAEVKNKFKFFINPDGVMGVNANVHPDGVLYKVINCNKGVGGMDTKLYEESIDTGLRELSDRFAITPLHSSNHMFALKGEFLCDPETGGTGIRHNDGTITLIDELNRKKEHIDIFEQKLILANIGRYSIYDMQFDDTSRVKVYFRGANLLDNEVLIERTNGKNIGKIGLSLDVTVLQKSGDDDILRWSNHDPSITITYYLQKDHKGGHRYTQVASRLGDRFIEINSPCLVISSIVLNLPTNALDEDVDNPLVEDGDSIDLTKGVTINDNNYSDPELEPQDGHEFGCLPDDDDVDCVCTGETSGTPETPLPPVITDDIPEDKPDYNDDELYKPIGSTDESETTEPMRCIVHSILIAMEEGDLRL